MLDASVLPRPANWSQIFANANPLEVEIGFGNGEYLARISKENPHVNYVGFEEYCARIQRTLRKLNIVGVSNARVLRFDARPGLQYLFAPQTVRTMYCLFPPPWPKKSDAKHRLFTREFLTLVNNRLIDGGVFKIVTDHLPLTDWTQEHIPTEGFDIEFKRIPASYGTKFERKWAEGGQQEFFEINLKKKAHLSVPNIKEADVQHYVIKAFDPERFLFENYSRDGIAVAFKDFLFDAKRQTALVHVIVNEENLLQHIRIVIVKRPDGWMVTLAEGTLQMPTRGVAKAVELVKDAASV